MPQRARNVVLSLALLPSLAIAGCGLPKTGAYFHPAIADAGPSLDNYGEAIVPTRGLIVVQGDDLIYGTAAKRGRPPINGAAAPRQALTITESMRQVLRGVEIDNFGYPGDSIVDGFERWAGRPKGDLVIFCYGLGDLRAKTPPATYEQTLRLMVRRAHASGAAVFVLVWPSLSDVKLSRGIEPYRVAARKAGVEEGAEVFESYQALDRAYIPAPKSPDLTPQLLRVIAGDMAAYIKVVAPSVRPASPQTGQAGSGPTATVRTSADSAS